MHHPSEDAMKPIVRIPELDREISSAGFRAAMRCLAGGVSVITAGAGREISGMTVTSVSSLSVDPPSLIVSVNRESSSWPLLKRYRYFGVNILGADQVDVAERFAGKDGLKSAERFAGAEWTERASGARLLRGALAAIECEAEDIIERHSHAIIIGRVLHVELSTQEAALAYWHGDYVAIDREEDMVRLADVSLPAGHVRMAQTVTRFSRREG
jgi:flavin reductase (DIM6/NTAB) family NADH-FMN oxidoreductase RutF